ncbi:MAG: glutathione S-transferase family protein [Cohaesibacteraceae bacterium]|nr:glutathione S-transferase family protein [Cohaesibacteraceae bacterium]MBL4876288.1 glutathione S-transferase family protein [Cohaesibacteraceae bacterium]
MLKLYHYTLDASSRFARLLLEEYKADYALVERKPWVRDEKLLELNPAGELPVFVEQDGPAICGGMNVSEYLDDTRGLAMGRARLMPDHPHARAEVRRLISWFLYKTEKDVTSYLVNEKAAKRQGRKEPGMNGTPDSAILRAARSNLKTHLDYVEFLTGNRNWIAGDKMTSADFAAAAVFSVLDYLGEIPWKADSATKSWYQRIKSRPGFRSILADKVRGLPPSSTYADLDF